MESPVDSRFGRAAFFLVVDTESGSVETHSNDQNVNAAQGAGIQAAEAVARLGADVSRPSTSSRAASCYRPPPPMWTGTGDRLRRVER